MSGVTGSSTAPCPLIFGVLKYHLISVLSAMMEKGDRQRGFALGLLNFHGNLARLIESHFPANFSSFALLLGCRARAANVTAGSCLFVAQSLVMEKSCPGKCCCQYLIRDDNANFGLKIFA